jgi:hypothetical protein
MLSKCRQMHYEQKGINTPLIVHSLCELGHTDRITGSLYSVHSLWNSKYSKIQHFQNWVCFGLQVRGGRPTLLGPLGGANLSDWTTLCHLATDIYAPDTRLIQRQVTGKYAVKDCGEARTEWNNDTVGGDCFCHKSVQQTKPLTPMYENEWRIMKPTMCLLLEPSME